MVAAKVTQLGLCGVTRRISGTAIKAGGALLALYEIMLTEAPSTDAPASIPLDGSSSDEMERQPPAASSDNVTSGAGAVPGIALERE